MRLDKYIAQATGQSRKEARRQIAHGAVSVDGMRVTQPGYIVASDACVHCADQALSAPGFEYWMVHKPVGYVSATKDEQFPVVTDLVDSYARNLHLAGRLDRDVTGLVLVSNDGNWTHAITSPRRDCAKTYLVNTDTPIPTDASEQVMRGILLTGEARPTKPGVLHILAPTQARLCITEGRYHQVKRMFLAMGCTVVKLHREAIGPLQLDIPQGQVRQLNSAEIAALRNSATTI